MSKSYDPEVDGAIMSFENKMAYSDYLNLEKVLSAQNVRTGAHDEMLFIIQHQTSELWIKLVVHELTAARDAIRANHLQTSFKMLARVSRIFEQLNSAWDVLRTMTPSDYTHFRDELGQSSGFQSYQYRFIEYILGNRNTAMLKPYEHEPKIINILKEELARSSLYGEVLSLLDRRGVMIPRAVLSRDPSNTHTPDDGVIAAWKQIYQAPEDNWELYEMAEKLIDLEDYFRRWRFNHVTTVERVIGFKRGTGGTAGVSYLKRMLSVELFPELWHVRTHL
ncbi:MAG: tryptophan 2,3-dioxygenase [Proteobacteria bacterium]|nr:tryptophan 2,3-dioxygenase [Pseudomonadota bacterium]